MRSSILVGKAVAAVSKLRNRAGSTWPGHLALKVDSEFVRNILNKNPNLDIILVAGTNGKTTTTKLIQEVLESQGKKVFRNEAGANLLNGIASTLIKHAGLNGKIDYDIAILEVDENSLPLVISELSKIESKISIVLLNLFRDQLDRYGEVNSIAKKWLSSLQSLSRSDLDIRSDLIVNGDDPMLRFIGENSNLHAFYFGLPERYMKKKDAPHDVDFLYCPHCSTSLTYLKRSYSHMGIYKCTHCGYRHWETATFDKLPNPMFGIYNRYNINAATLLLQKAYGIDPKNVEQVLKVFAPAFGRQEKIEYNGKEIFLLLSKNPTGFNQSIEAILESQRLTRSDLNEKKNLNVLLILNDRIPDGRDVSWIWDVDFEQLAQKVSLLTVSGDRAFDMGLRVKYAQESQNPKGKEQKYNSKVKIIQNVQESLDFATQTLEKDETLYVLATYSAMLDIRKILKGHAIL